MKRRSLLIVSIAISTQIAYGQSNDHNYTKTIVVRTPVQEERELSALTIDQKSVNIKYLDRLGRIEQQIQQQFTPGGKDLVSMKKLDGFGIDSVIYEPFSDGSSDGTFKSNAITSQQQFYQNASLVAHTSNPYSQKYYEKSPLLRTTEQSAPGFSWKMGNNHTIKKDYKFNSHSVDGDIQIWSLSSNNQSCSSNGTYSDKQLAVYETKDENSTSSSTGSIIREYYDLTGKLILKKQFAGASTYYCTYYVYDYKNNLTIIIPPKAVVNTTQFSNLIYWFNYDSHNRLIAKKIPGRQPINFVYDNLDRVVMSQDGNQQNQNQWTYYKYDIYGRLITTGIKQYSNAISTEQMQTAASSYADYVSTFPFEVNSTDSVTDPQHYTDLAFPQVIQNSSDIDMVYNYYDTYPISYLYGYYSFKTFSSPLNWLTSDMLSTQNYGKTTMIKNRLLDASSSTFLSTVYYYDKFGRPIEILSDNHLGGLDVTIYQYDFDGKILQSAFIHNFSHSTSGNFPYPTETIVENYSYDAQGRLKQHTHQINNQSPVILSNFKYNELGQVVEKDLHSTNSGVNYLQNVDYRYNTRGWLTSINQCDLTVSTTFSGNDILPSEIVTKLRLDTIMVQFDKYTDERGNHYIRSTFGDVKKLSIVNLSDSSNNRVIQNNENNYTDYYQYRSTDSISYVRLNNLSTSQLTFDFQGLYFDENTDLAEFLDKIASSVDEQLKLHDIEDSTIRAILHSIVQIQEENVTGVIYFNRNQADLFGENLYYDQAFGLPLNVPAQFNGNISTMFWQATQFTGQRVYAYQYDNLNQLISARYAEKNPNGWTKNVDRYSEKRISYDANGNIQFLERDGHVNTINGTYGMIDVLQYSYDGTGNQLKAVQDSITWNTMNNDFRDNASNQTEYAYDANGNLIRDDNKGITSISYNFMNLPTEIDFGNSSGDKIIYIYNALGVKVCKKVYQGNILKSQYDYSPGVVYQALNSGTSSLQFIGTSEGRLVPDNNGIFAYQYFLTDHLGNIRVVFGDPDNNGVPDVIQEDHYYPFGLPISDLYYNVDPQNQYKYQSKELQNDGFKVYNSSITNSYLETYDFQARQYDPQLGRWHVPDPLSQHSSPYLAMGNNPISSVDPNGTKDVWNHNSYMRRKVISDCPTDENSGGHLGPLDEMYFDFSSYYQDFGPQNIPLSLDGHFGGGASLSDRLSNKQDAEAAFYEETNTGVVALDLVNLAPKPPDEATFEDETLDLANLAPKPPDEATFGDENAGRRKPKLYLIGSTSFEKDDEWNQWPLNYSLEAGQHVQIVITNNNYFGAQIEVEDRTTWSLRDGWLVNSYDYDGASYNSVILQFQTKTFDFYRPGYDHRTWSFYFDSTISSGINVSIHFYSEWSNK